MDMLEGIFGCYTKCILLFNYEYFHILFIISLLLTAWKLLLEIKNYILKFVSKYLGSRIKHTIQFNQEEKS